MYFNINFNYKEPMAEQINGKCSAEIYLVYTHTCSKGLLEKCKLHSLIPNWVMVDVIQEICYRVKRGLPAINEIVAQYIYRQSNIMSPEGAQGQSLVLLYSWPHAISILNVLLCMLPA